MSHKPTREFTVCTGPVAIPAGDDRYEIVKPPMRHVVQGCEVKYIVGPDFFQIVDRVGSVVFNCPLHSVLWCSTNDAPPKLYCLDDLDDVTDPP